MWFYVICTAFTATVAYSATVNRLPPSVEVCQLGPKFERCVEKSIEAAMQELAGGYDPLGTLPLDPLQIPALAIEQGGGPVSVNITFKDLRVAGLKSMKVRNFKADIDNLKMSGDISVPKITIDGLYTINGKVLVLPIVGDGNSKIILDDINGNFGLKGTRIRKSGVTYMKVSEFDFNFDPKKMSIDLENLFNGDKLIADNMNLFLNENSIEILKELKPAIQEAFGKAFAWTTNRIFTKIPLDDILPK